MIQVSVRPDTLVAGQAAVLRIGLSNTGQGTCSDVFFRLKLPPGMALVSGTTTIDVKEIPPQHEHAHQVTVRPGAAGEVEVGTTNFAYRDEDGVGQRHDWRASIRVQAARAAPPPPAQTRSPGQSRLTVSYGGGKLAPDEWDSLDIVLRNATGVPLRDVTLTIGGPFQAAAPDPIRLLLDGETRRVPISVRVTDRGKIPVQIHTTYRYQDNRGQLNARAQDDKLIVEVAAPMVTVPPPEDKAPVTTILYLVAQPDDQPPLDTYREMRKVEELLQLGQDRERYRLTHRVAARLEDISQGLGDRKPQLVHFAGHGRSDGSLAVEDHSGRTAYVNPDGLAELLGGFAPSLRCVVVNACQSLILAEAIVKYVDYAVGMRSEILDPASVQFSVGFYQGLFAGKAIPDAFQQGRALVRANMGTNSQYQVPVLLKRRT